MTRGEGRTPANVAIARDLGIAIVTGVYAPGAILPGELDLAERMKVSRSVIREALRALVAKGLVASKPRAGTRVTPRESWNMLDPDLLAWMFEGAPPLEFVRNLFELRLIVEPAAAELAARGRTARHLSEMGHSLEVMAQRGLSTPEGQAADRKFHAAILEATNNALLASLSSTIAAAVQWTTFFKYRTRRRFEDPIPPHRALFEAIANGDGAAARQATIDLVTQAQLDTEISLDP